VSTPELLYSEDVTQTQALTAKGRATRERIVVAASDLMLDQGVAGTSTQDVQVAAGVSSSQLYHYFVDKRSLVSAVIAHQTEGVLGFQLPLLSRLDSLDALQAWRDVIVSFQAQRHCLGGCPLGSLASELSDQDPLAREDLMLSFSRWEAALRDGLQAMCARGELSEQADADKLALALLTALQGGLLLSQLRRDTRPLEAGLDAVIGHVRSFAKPVGGSAEG
jgi:TetR/AcrR family transcriptional repressor of nem operon